MHSGRRNNWGDSPSVFRVQLLSALIQYLRGHTPRGTDSPTVGGWMYHHHQAKHLTPPPHTHTQLATCNLTFSLIFMVSTCHKDPPTLPPATKQWEGYWDTLLHINQKCLNKWLVCCICTVVILWMTGYKLPVIHNKLGRSFIVTSFHSAQHRQQRWESSDNPRYITTIWCYCDFFFLIIILIVLQ